MKVLLLTVGFFVFVTRSIAQPDSLWSLDDVSNITVLLYQPINDSTGKIGSGTIINYNGRHFLLTANHVAKEMKKDSKLVFRFAGDTPGVVDLLSISDGQKLNWLNHPIADLSLIELTANNMEVEQRLNRWSFPSYLIYRGKETASRDADITFLGYPIVDLEFEHLSPLTFNSHLASGLITQNRGDTDIKCTFYFLDIPSMQGCSGSGVYNSVKKRVSDGAGKTMLIGVVHGTASINTHGKLAAITPSCYIWDLLREYNTKWTPVTQRTMIRTMKDKE